MKALKEALFSKKNIEKINHKSISTALKEFRVNKDDYSDEDFCTVLITDDNRKVDEHSIYIFIYLSDTEEVEEFWRSITENTKFTLDYENLYDDVNHNNGYGIIVFFNENGDLTSMSIEEDKDDLYMVYDIIENTGVINKISSNKKYYTDICKYINKNAKAFGIC